MEIEYRLIVINNLFSEETSQIRIADQFSESDYQKIENSIVYIERVNNLFCLEEYVYFNLFDFDIKVDESIESYTASSGYWNGFTREDFELIYMNLNRLLMNYLNSFTSLIGHLEKYVKQNHSSLLFESFKVGLSKLYNQYFSYRFLYKFRNYAQHIELPIQNITFGHKNESSEGLKKIKFHIKLNPNQLLRDYDSWGTLKSELNAMTTEIDLIDILHDNFHPIQELMNFFYETIKEEINCHVEIINHFTQHLIADNLEIGLAIVSLDANQYKKIDQRQIPFYIIQKLKDRFK